MIEVLQFIFSSFYVWLGTVILVGITLNGLASIIEAIHKKGGEV